MKKLAFILAAALMLPLAADAQKKEKKPKAEKPLKSTSAYVFAQSQRNSEQRGSCLALTTGETYSLALEKKMPDKTVSTTVEKDIDVMLFHGKANGVKDYVFHLFSPENPSMTIDWNKDGGTSPWCKFEGKSDDPDASYALKNWKKRNATRLEFAGDDVNFDTATQSSLDSMTVAESYIVSDVKVGDVIKFQLAETSYKPNKKGLIKVIAIEDDPNGKPENKGRGQYQRLILEIKLQK